MKFKEFSRWCNNRACDGCWGMSEANICVRACEEIYTYPFWKREKIWKEKYKDEIENKIVNRTNELIREYRGSQWKI